MASSCTVKVPSPDVKLSSSLEARRAARQSRSRPWLCGRRPELKGKIDVTPSPTAACPKVVKVTTSSRIPRIVASPGLPFPLSASFPVKGSVASVDASGVASRLPRRVQRPSSSVEVQAEEVKVGARVRFAEPSPVHGSCREVSSSSPHSSLLRRASVRGGGGSSRPSPEGLVRQMSRLRVSGGNGDCKATQKVAPKKGRSAGGAERASVLVRPLKSCLRSGIASGRKPKSSVRFRPRRSLEEVGFTVKENGWRKSVEYLLCGCAL